MNQIGRIRMDAFWAETEKLKLKLLAAYGKLADEGKLNEKQMDQIAILLDEMDKYGQEEFAEKLREICGSLPGE
jgi:hypothetical protein